MSERAYKWLRPDHRGAHNHGDYASHLPKGKRPGRWMPVLADPRLCERGYHVTSLGHLMDHWAADAILFEVECRGQADRGGDKSAWEEIRLLRRVGQLTHSQLVAFACDCAERVGQDPAGREAIAAARAWVACPCEEHRGAAWAAAAAAEARRWQGERLLEMLEERG